MRLDVTMDEPGAVSIAQSGASLNDERDARFYRKSPALTDELFEVFAGDMLHDNEEQVIRKSEIMDGDYIGMLQIRGGSRLCPKVFLEIRAA